MITKGYLLNVFHEQFESVLAVSENLQELEDKIEDLKKKDEEKKSRLANLSNDIASYRANFHKNVYSEDSNYYYEIKNFVNENPIPDEIKEFVKYSEDKNTGNLYFYSMRDLTIKYWITNILGFN